MSPELSRRVAYAFRAGGATLDERDALVAAVVSAGVRSVEDLPGDARQLLADLETRAARRG